MTTINTEINNVLAQIRAASAEIKSPPAVDRSADGTQAQRPAFGELLETAVSSVSRQQQLAETLATRFQAGDADTSIAEVVVEMQKASVSFQAMAEARNRIIEAYREIMNMSV